MSDGKDQTDQDSSGAPDPSQLPPKPVDGKSSNGSRARSSRGKKERKKKRRSTGGSKGGTRGSSSKSKKEPPQATPPASAAGEGSGAAPPSAADPDNAAQLAAKTLSIDQPGSGIGGVQLPSAVVEASGGPIAEVALGEEKPRYPEETPAGDPEGGTYISVDSVQMHTGEDGQRYKNAFKELQDYGTLSFEPGQTLTHEDVAAMRSRMRSGSALSSMVRGRTTSTPAVPTPTTTDTMTIEDDDLADLYPEKTDCEYITFGLSREMVALVTIVALGVLGIFAAEFRVDVLRFIAPPLVFFVAGLSLPVTYPILLWEQRKVHVVSMLWNYLVITLLTLAVSFLLSPTPNEPGTGVFGIELVSGLFALALAPPSLQAMNFVEFAGGLRRMARINLTLAQLVGAFTTPILILVVAPIASTLDLVSVVTNLGLLGYGPFIVGLAVRVPLDSRLAEVNLGPVRTAGGCACLWLMSATYFGDRIVSSTVSMEDIIIMVIVVTSVYILGVIGIYALTSFRSLRFTWFAVHKRVAVVFCGTSRSFSLSMAIISILFADSPIGLLVAVPLIAFRLIHSLLGPFIALLLKSGIDLVAQEERLRQAKRQAENDAAADDLAGN